LGLPAGGVPLTKPRRTPIYAIVRSGGKQYRVQADQVLDVDRLHADVGSTVELKDVLLLSGQGDVRVGTPLVDGATVVAEVLEHGRDKKIHVFKYKNKTRYRRRFGHRQDFTRLAIRQILADGKALEAEPAEKPKRPARKKAAPKKKEPVAEATETAMEEPPVEAPVAEAAEATPPAAASPEAEAPKPRRARATKPKADAESPKPPRRRATKPTAEAEPEPAPAAQDTPEGE
jgi:large subunit ribosomal protein L21